MDPRDAVAAAPAAPSAAPLAAPPAAPLADLCERDPLDLDADPRTCAGPRRAPEPCGPLCTPWCLASHG